MNQQKRLGASMYVLAAVTLLGLLTLLFSGMLDKQQNPNSKPHSTVDAGGNIEVILQANRGGHYVTNGWVNEQEVEFMLDTGATAVAVPAELADDLSLIPGYEVESYTANGIARVRTTMIDELRIGDFVEYQIPATLVPNLPGGQILLGMSFLKRLDFSQRGDTLILESRREQR